LLLLLANTLFNILDFQLFINLKPQSKTIINKLNLITCGLHVELPEGGGAHVEAQFSFSSGFLLPDHTLSHSDTRLSIKEATPRNNV